MPPIRDHFVVVPDAAKVLDAIDRDVDPPAAPLRQVLNTRVGGLIFKSFEVRLHLFEFVENVKKRMDDLEDVNFDPEEFKSIQAVFKRDADVMKDIGIGSWDRQTTKISFLGSDMEIESSGLTDMWKKHFHARVRSVAVRRQLVRLLPWEELLFENPSAKLDNVRATVDLPSEYLKETNRARDAAWAIIQDTQPTIADMKKIMLESRKALRQLDPFFELELKFLNDFAEPLLNQQLKDSVLAMLPTPDRPSTAAETTSNLTKVMQTKQYLAASVTTRSELDAVSHLVQGVADDVAPEPSMVVQSTEFFSTCLQRIQNFVTVEVQAGRSKKPQRLVGRLAIEWYFDDTQKAVARGETRTLKDIKMLAIFKYALASEKRLQVAEWQKSFIRNHMVQHKAICANPAVADKKKKGCPNKGNNGQLNSSRASSPSAIVPATMPSTGKSAKMENQVRDAMKNFSTPRNPNRQERGHYMSASCSAKHAIVSTTLSEAYAIDGRGCSVARFHRCGKSLSSHPVLSESSQFASRAAASSVLFNSGGFVTFGWPGSKTAGFKQTYASPKTEAKKSTSNIAHRRKNVSSHDEFFSLS